MGVPAETLRKHGQAKTGHDAENRRQILRRTEFSGNHVKHRTHNARYAVELAWQKDTRNLQAWQQ